MMYQERRTLGVSVQVLHNKKDSQIGFQWAHGWPQKREPRQRRKTVQRQRQGWTDPVHIFEILNSSGTKRSIECIFLLLLIKPHSAFTYMVTCFISTHLKQPCIVYTRPCHGESALVKRREDLCFDVDVSHPLSWRNSFVRMRACLSRASSGLIQAHRCTYPDRW